MKSKDKKDKAELINKIKDTAHKPCTDAVDWEQLKRYLFQGINPTTTHDKQQGQGESKLLKFETSVEYKIWFA